MRTCRIILLAVVAGALGAGSTRAQETNAPLTNLEAFETQTGTVIVKGNALIGTITAPTGIVSVRCKESTETSSGRKEYGIAVGLKEGEHLEDTTLIDYDEFDSLLSGLNYLCKVDHAVTSLPNFDAVYNTGGGLHIAVFNSTRRAGTILASLESGRVTTNRVLLATSQLIQFRDMIQQAKSKLDSIRTKK